MIMLKYLSYETANGEHLGRQVYYAGFSIIYHRYYGKYTPENKA